VKRNLLTGWPPRNTLRQSSSPICWRPRQWRPRAADSPPKVRGGAESVRRDGRRHLTPADWRGVLRAAQAARNAYRAGFGPRAVADAAARELATADWLARVMTHALFAGLAAKGQLAFDPRTLDRALVEHARFRDDMARYGLRLAPRRPSHQSQRDSLPVDAARATPIAEVVQRCGIELRRTGRELVGRCPFHDDRRPSLRVHPERGVWYCHPCGRGGDAIGFVQQLRGCDFAAAVQEVAA
jgi:hypothetical protein